MIRTLSRDMRGASAVEFALVAPTFLMFLFLLLDGARMMFTKQALYELSEAASRCAAVNSALCPLTGSSTVADWAAARGRTRSNLALVSADVVVTQVATATSGICGGQAGMMRAVISLPYRKGTMTLLPQSIVPTTLVATSCFPIAG